ncbi:MAG: oxidoreductase [Frankiales bacterium]|nr:oxidoreductase [Frankiales bacterium]
MRRAGEEEGKAVATDDAERGAMQHPRLAEPFILNGHTLKNRMVWTAHDTNMADRSHHVSPEQADYFVARAAGGVGFIVMEASSVHPTAEIHGTSVHAYDAGVVPGYRDLAARIHEHGTAIVVQLAHQGVHMNFHKNWTYGWAPSLVPSVVEREIPHILTAAEIAELVDAYAASAANAVAGDLDGVEVSASHSYLPAQFLSPYYNRRTDEYGGSLEGRFRFLREVLTAVRAAIGLDKILGLRISGDELTSFGMHVEDSIAISKLVEESGLVDYLSVSAGSMHTRHMIVPPMAAPQGYQLPFASQIKHAIGLPVIVIGRITHPDMAEQVLEAGNADLIAMTRAQIAEPEFANKVLTGRTDQIRPCIGCNQGCRERFFLGKSITCTTNPLSGRELRSRSWLPAPAHRTAIVVGGGPAGLQAAVALAEHGASVDLYEATDRLGGQVLRAAQLPARSEIALIVDFLAAECRRLGVRIHFDETWDTTRLVGTGPHVLALATGSSPRSYPFAEYPGETIPGIEPARAWNVWDAVALKPSGSRILVVDERGRYEGLGVAELLRQDGREVTVVSTMDTVGDRIRATGDLPMIMGRLLQSGVDVIGSHAIASIDGTSVTLRNMYAPQRRRLIEGIDDIVFVCGNQVIDVPGLEPGAAPPSQLATTRIVRVGDCQAPRGLDEAIYEGLRVTYLPEPVTKVERAGVA